MPFPTVHITDLCSLKLTVFLYIWVRTDGLIRAVFCRSKGKNQVIAERKEGQASISVRYTTCTYTCLDYNRSYFSFWLPAGINYGRHDCICDSNFARLYYNSYTPTCNVPSGPNSYSLTELYPHPRRNESLSY